MNTSFPMTAMRIAFAVLVVSVMLSSAAWAAVEVTISSNYLRAGVYSDNSGSDYEYFYGTTIPTSTSIRATLGGDPEYYSDVQIDYSKTGGQTVLTHEFDQYRSGDYYDHSYAFDNSMYFTVDANTTYDLSGSYSVTDVGDPGYAYFGSNLYDHTANTYLFDNTQNSYYTPDETFDLGGVGGDNYNYLGGSLTGNLIAGHSYSWYSEGTTYAYPDSDSGASAEGFVSLAIGTAVVPEPTTFIVWSLLGLTASGFTCQRRRKSRA